MVAEENFSSISKYIEMLLDSKQIHSSLFLFLTLVPKLSNLAFLSGNALAVSTSEDFIGPDTRYPLNPTLWLWHLTVPETSDYPSDEEIKEKFQGMGPNQALMMVISKSNQNKYKEYCGWMTCLPLTFTSGYLRRNGRSKRWLKDFYARLNAVYMAGASGIAYILIDVLSQPECLYFWDIRNHLVANEKVSRIMLVTASSWDDQVELWSRDDDTQANDENRDDRPGGEDGDTGENDRSLSGRPGIGDSETGGSDDGTGNFALHATTSLIPAAGAGGSISGSIGGLGTLKSTNPPAWPSYSKDGQEKGSGVETDVFLSPVASLPSSDGVAVGTNGESMLPTDGTSPPELQTDRLSIGKTLATDSTSEGTSAIGNLGLKTGDGTADKNPDFSNLFQRRGRMLLPRDSDNCMGWLTETGLDFSEESSPPDAAADSSSNPDTPTPPATDWNFEKVDPFTDTDAATLSITQYDTGNGNFRLDIPVQAGGKVIYYAQGVNAPPGKKVEVPVPWKLGNGITASWPVSVSTGKNVQDPLEVEYEDPYMTEPLKLNPFGKFDSNDHTKCHVTDWVGSKRDIQCSIVAVHPSLPGNY